MKVLQLKAPRLTKAPRLVGVFNGMKVYASEDVGRDEVWAMNTGDWRLRDEDAIYVCPKCLHPYPWPALVCSQCGRSMNSWFAEDTGPVYPGALGVELDVFDDGEQPIVAAHDHWYFWASLFKGPLAAKIRAYADSCMNSALAKKASNVYFDRTVGGSKLEQREKQVRNFGVRRVLRWFRFGRDHDLLPEDE